MMGELLTKYNCAAFDLLRIRAMQERKIPPWWLCMSEEAREEAREALRLLLQSKVASPHLAMVDAERLADNVPDRLFDLWCVAEREAEAERMREAGNPRAYFAG